MTKVNRQNEPEHKHNPRVTARTLTVVRILMVLFKSTLLCSVLWIRTCSAKYET